MPAAYLPRRQCHCPQRRAGSSGDPASGSRVPAASSCCSKLARVPQPTSLPQLLPWPILPFMKTILLPTGSSSPSPKSASPIYSPSPISSKLTLQSSGVKRRRGNATVTDDTIAPACTFLFSFLREVHCSATTHYSLGHAPTHRVLSEYCQTAGQNQESRRAACRDRFDAWTGDPSRQSRRGHGCLHLLQARLCRLQGRHLPVLPIEQLQ